MLVDMPEQYSPHPLPFQITNDLARHLPSLVSTGVGEEQPDPHLIILNEGLAQELGLDAEWLRSAEGLSFLLGRRNPPELPPQALAYAGHQFGSFNPQLGDGRALLLGEVRAQSGAWDGQLVDLHVKGAGPTPFSRVGSDGRGGIGPMLREYLVSEAMHAIGVPTARALAVIATGRQIQRDRVVPAAVVVRAATSHLRVGTAQFAQMAGGPELVENVVDYTCQRHFPDLEEVDGTVPDKVTEFFRAVMDAQAATVARWQRLGFIHGVMNTDNTTLSGQTIDYGPCAFMENYDLDTVFSSIDRQGRYRFGNQPAILGWNLARLVETLVPLLSDEPNQGIELAQSLINEFGERYAAADHSEMAQALNLDEEAAESAELISGYRQLLVQDRPDLTNTNRALVSAAAGNTTPLRELLPSDAGWIDQWLSTQDGDAAELLGRFHPLVVPRNIALHRALKEAEDGSYDLFHQLADATASPYSELGEHINPQLAQELTNPDPNELQGFLTFCGT